MLTRWLKKYSGTSNLNGLSSHPEAKQCDSTDKPEYGEYVYDNAKGDFHKHRITQNDNAEIRFDTDSS